MQAVAFFTKKLNIEEAHMKKTFLALIAIIALAACAAAQPAAPIPAPADALLQEELPGEEATLELPGEAPPATQEAPPGFTVIDQAGREVYIAAPIERLVSGFFVSTSACIALGITDMMVGVNSRVYDRPLFVKAAPELLDLPDVGTARNFNLETAAALEPDLVILPLRLLESGEILAELGITVIMVNPESHDELVEMIELIGKATGATERAERLVNHYRSELLAIAALVESVETRPTVLMGGNSSHLTAAPLEMYQSSIIYSAGGTNAAHSLDGQFWTEISYEQYLYFNPSVIIIPSEAVYGVDDILGNPQLQAVDAVVSGRVYQMPRGFEAWDAPVPSGILGVRWLLHVLHPELFSFEELFENAAAFYLEFYGIEIDALY